MAPATRHIEIYGQNVDQYFDTLTSAAEHLEIDRWCAANDARGIEYIVIDKPAVFVHGCTPEFVGVSGNAGRRGALTGELTAAMAMMHKARDL
jgi:hypothetical protein